MKMRTKLLAAQVPLVIALLLAFGVGVVVTRDLGRGATNILKDNYRSVLAAERIKESVERIDSGVLFTMADKRAEGFAQIDANMAKLETELAAQESNLTERGEPEATKRLRSAWTAYRRDLDEIRAIVDPLAIRDRYFATLLPAFLATKDLADAILAINQDAMTAKSDRASRLASRANTVLIGVSIAGLLLGVIAASVITARVLRPLSVVEQTARRLGEGDVAVRAVVPGTDEIAALARELNTMADRIQKYRESSLGDLVEAQLAAQATIDSLPDPVVVVGLDGALRHANEAAETLLGVRTEDGAAALAALDPAVRTAIERMREHVAAGRGAFVPKGLDEAIEIRGGTTSTMLLARATPLYAQEGDVAAVTVVFQDVTRLHRFDQLRNDLVATVAHELRTPLTSLRMAVHLMSEETVGPLTAKQADLVFAAREDCDRLQSIVDELLDLSRIQADRIELRTAAIDPERLIGDAIDAEHALAETKRVQLRTEILPNMPAVTVDRERIQLVFANLVGNALRYGPEGGTITLRAMVTGDRMRFEVIDQGPGIPVEHRETIFDKYVRLPGSPAGGSGIGLFIAREVVRAHGGEIGVDGTQAGSTFWFTVPLAEPEVAA